MNPALDHENAIRRTFSDFPLPKRVKLILGLALLAAMPGMASRSYRSTFRESGGLIDGLVRNGLQARAFMEGDHARLRSYLADYWGAYASQFHEDWDHRFERLFLKRDVEVIDCLEEWLATTPGGRGVRRFYEIGCGGGRLLAYLAGRFPAVELLTGIDLGEERIAENRAYYRDNPRLEFHAADAMEWIRANAGAGSVFLANGGVLEYFLKEELTDLFRSMAEDLSPVAVVLIETIGVDHDLDHEKDSFVYGREMAFSHNYPHLLESAGFTIRHQSQCEGEATDGGGRWIRLLATCESGDTPAPGR